MFAIKLNFCICLISLEISFDTEQLRDLCEDESLAAHALGPDCAEVLKRRLADLRAANSIFDILVGQPQAGEYMEMECYRIRLINGKCLTILSNHTPPRTNAAGTTDWEWVRRIRVVSLEP